MTRPFRKFCEFHIEYDKIQFISVDVGGPILNVENAFLFKKRSLKIKGFYHHKNNEK